MVLGETTLSAPARRSLASALRSMDLATMRRAGLSARAVTVTYRLSLSSVSAEMIPRARVMPASSRTSSCVASPTTAAPPCRRTASWATASFVSTTTKGVPSWESSRMAWIPVEPAPHTTTWSRIFASCDAMRRLHPRPSTSPSTRKAVTEPRNHQRTTVPVATRTSVNGRPSGTSPTGSISPNPTVETVVTVM